MVDRVVESQFKEGIYTYSHEYIPCGKKGCTKCPHGPYWYVRWTKGGKKYCKYIGKVLITVGAKKNFDPERDLVEKMKTRNTG